MILSSWIKIFCGKYFFNTTLEINYTCSHYFSTNPDVIPTGKSPLPVTIANILFRIFFQVNINHEIWQKINKHIDVKQFKTNACNLGYFLLHIKFLTLDILPSCKYVYVNFLFCLREYHTRNIGKKKRKRNNRNYNVPDTSSVFTEERFRSLSDFVTPTKVFRRLTFAQFKKRQWLILDHLLQN